MSEKSKLMKRHFILTLKMKSDVPEFDNRDQIDLLKKFFKETVNQAVASQCEEEEMLALQETTCEYVEY